MKKLIKKLKSSSGESIGETLVALLIAALALLMLAVAITATTRIINNSSEKVDDYFDKSNTSELSRSNPVIAFKKKDD